MYRYNTHTVTKYRNSSGALPRFNAGSRIIENNFEGMFFSISSTCEGLNSAGQVNIYLTLPALKWAKSHYFQQSLTGNILPESAPDPENTLIRCILRSIIIIISKFIFICYVNLPPFCYFLLHYVSCIYFLLIRYITSDTQWVISVHICKL